MHVDYMTNVQVRGEPITIPNFVIEENKKTPNKEKNSRPISFFKSGKIIKCAILCSNQKVHYML